MEVHKALARAQAYCAKAERSRADVSQKLQQWLVPAFEHPNIIAALEEENFLNEERFAHAFANDKFRFERWGRFKIKIGLQQKGVPPHLIADAMSRAIPTADYRQTALELLAKKQAQLDTERYNIAQQNQKKANYLLQKGFEPALVWELISEQKILAD